MQFRWNVSGTYQQVLPRYISIDPAGREREFLPEYFSSPQEALHMEFRKGYEWPFDTEKLRGSSRIDCIVSVSYTHLSIPSLPKSASCSSSERDGSFSFSFISLYSKPLVLKLSLIHI